MAGATRRPRSAERVIEVTRVKFTKARRKNGDQIHAIDTAYLRWLTGMFEETAVITYVTKCGGARQMVDPIPVPDNRRVTCPGCLKWIKRESGAQ